MTMDEEKSLTFYKEACYLLHKWKFGTNIREDVEEAAKRVGATYDELRSVIKHLRTRYLDMYNTKVAKGKFEGDFFAFYNSIRKPRGRPSAGRAPRARPAAGTSSSSASSNPSSPSLTYKTGDISRLVTGAGDLTNDVLLGPRVRRKPAIYDPQINKAGGPQQIKRHRGNGNKHSRPSFEGASSEHNGYMAPAAFVKQQQQQQQQRTRGGPNLRWLPRSTEFYPGSYAREEYVDGAYDYDDMDDSKLPLSAHCNQGFRSFENVYDREWAMKGYRARNKQHTGTSPIYYNDYYEDSQCGRNSPVYHNDLQDEDDEDEESEDEDEEPFVSSYTENIPLPPRKRIRALGSNVKKSTMQQHNADDNNNSNNKANDSDALLLLKLRERPPSPKSPATTATTSPPRLSPSDSNASLSSQATAFIPYSPQSSASSITVPYVVSRRTSPTPSTQTTTHTHTHTHTHTVSHPLPSNCTAGLSINDPLPTKIMTLPTAKRLNVSVSMAAAAAAKSAMRAQREGTTPAVTHTVCDGRVAAPQWPSQAERAAADILTRIMSTTSVSSY